MIKKEGGHDKKKEGRGKRTLWRYMQREEAKIDGEEMLRRREARGNGKVWMVGRKENWRHVVLRGGKRKSLFVQWSKALPQNKEV